MRNTKITRILMFGAASTLLLGGLAIPLPNDAPLYTVQPANAASVRISIFFDSLAPYGTWVEHGRYGYVFVPDVSAGWRPYTHGHWVYTEHYGWYWVSDEPFAWAVYHYGRWSYDPAYGWAWVPGNVWGPAWVTWSYGGGHVGWAPIGPYGDGYIYGIPDYYEPPIIEAWVFVPERRFISVNIGRYVVPAAEINIVLGRARERHHVRYRDGKVINPFLPRERARQFVKEEINVYNVDRVGDPSKASRADRSDGREIRAFSPEITKEKPEKKPGKVAKRPEEVKSRPMLKETVRGERPEGAPPSAAKLQPGPKPGQAESVDKAPARPGPASAEPKTDREKVEDGKKSDQKDRDKQARTKGDRTPEAKREDESKAEKPSKQTRPDKFGKSKEAGKLDKTKAQIDKERPKREETKAQVPEKPNEKPAKGPPEYTGPPRSELRQMRKQEDEPRGGPGEHKGKPN